MHLKLQNCYDVIWVGSGSRIWFLKSVARSKQLRVGLDLFDFDPNTKNIRTKHIGLDWIVGWFGFARTTEHPYSPCFTVEPEKTFYSSSFHDPWERVSHKAQEFEHFAFLFQCKTSQSLSKDIILYYEVSL